MRWVRRFPRSRGWWIGFGIPFGLALAGALLAQPRARTLLGIPLGPWAGEALGHHDCTMGTLLRGPSCAAGALGALALLLLGVARNPLARKAGLSLLVVWAWIWSALAWMSVVNTTS